MKLVPFGVVLGHDDREALVELIEALWRDGKIPGPVLGRRGHNHMHEEIENYNWLEILWVAAPPKGDYYNGEYENEVYAAPPLTNWAHVGTDYYRNEWKDLATTEQTLSRLRAEVSRPDPRPADAGLLAHVEETAAAGKPGLPDGSGNLLDPSCAGSDQPMPDLGEMQRLPEALAELREKAGIADRTRRPTDAPADVVAQRMQQIGEDVHGEFFRRLARGQFVAFLDTIYGLEPLPAGEYWLRPDGSPQPWVRQARISGTAPSGRHGRPPGVVMVRRADFRTFGAQYLSARGLAGDPFSSAAPGPRPRRPPPIEPVPKENSRLSPPKNAEAAISVPDQRDGKNPITRRPSREKPFWPEARKAAFAWLEESGFPCPGDGGQTKFEEHIAGWLMERGHQAAESTIRKHVKAWIEEYKADLSARD